MPSFVLEDLVQPVTRAEAQQSIYNVLGILGVNTTSWKPGAVVRTLLGATALVLSAFSELQAKIARSGFIELSDGAWLTLVAHYVYGVDRFDATFATGEVTLTNVGGGVFDFDADDLIFANPSTGMTYRNTEPVALGAVSTPTAVVNVPISATVAGVAGNAEPGAITQMVTTVLSVSCSNSAPLRGSDEETDAQLRERCKEQLGALSPMGPWDAYGAAVRNATHADGSSLGINRIRIVKDGFGTVTTYVANRGGAVDSTDLAIAHDAIERWATPVGVDPTTLSAVNHAIDVTYELWLYDTTTLTDAEIGQLVATALGDFFGAQPIGGNVIGSDPGKIFLSAIHGAIFDALPQIFRVVVTAPATDEVMAPEDVALLGDAVATALHREVPPMGFGGALNT
jgi:uncharacterized phage protein gp47/JayE